MGTTNKQKAIRAAYLANPNRCKNCDNPITPKGKEKLAETRKRMFCSRSCAATFNNLGDRFPKRKPVPRGLRTCKRCPNVFTPTQERNYREVLCPSCNENRATLADRKLKTDKGFRRYISDNARARLRGRQQVCAKCKYDKFVEACHIRPISDFPDTATASEVNADGNLILLCPNCHWELDHGMLKL